MYNLMVLMLTALQAKSKLNVACYQLLIAAEAERPQITRHRTQQMASGIRSRAANTTVSGQTALGAGDGASLLETIANQQDSLARVLETFADRQNSLVTAIRRHMNSPAPPI